jgi:hypothetical protein
MADEEDRQDIQEQVELHVSWWEVQAGYRPRAMGDSLGDRGSLSLIPTVEEQREQVREFTERLKRRPLASLDRPKADTEPK